MRILFRSLKAFIYMTGFALLWGWIALSVRPLDDRFNLLLPGWAEPIGVALMVGGGILALMCVAFFVVRGGGTQAPFDPPVAFVAAGPYRYVRNPMYIGVLFVLMGLGLYEHSISMLIFSLPWLLLAHLFVILVEEPGLERRFGSPYSEYKHSVRRWLPGAGWRNPPDHRKP